MSSVCPSLTLVDQDQWSVWSHRLEILETNCTDNLISPNTFSLRSPKAIHLLPGEFGETKNLTKKTLLSLILSLVRGLAPAGVSFVIFRHFFRRLIPEVAWPIVTKLCNVFGGDSDAHLQMFIRIFGVPSEKKIGGPKVQNHQTFGAISDNFATRYWSNSIHHSCRDN